MKRLLVAALVALTIAVTAASAAEPAPTATPVASTVGACDDVAAKLTAERRRHALEVRKLRRDIARINRGRHRDLFVPAGNREMAKAIARIYYGWTGRQWSALDALIRRESGWYHRADNPTSSAYGIPQSLPGSKMSRYGSDWQTNPVTQVVWGLDYIKRRYRNPVNALAHSHRYGWY